MFKQTVITLSLTALLAACGSTGNTGPTPGSGNTQPTGGIVKGIALGSDGTPIVGARIIIDNTVVANSAVTGRTGVDGRYSLQIPQEWSWRAYAQLEKTYNGRTFKLDLHPDNPDSFAGAQGAVRNFELRTTGPKPVPLVGTYGGQVYVYRNPDQSFDEHDVEITLTPVGKLIDGSNGQTITTRPIESQIADVPIGRYAISAKLVTTGQALLIKDQLANTYENTTTQDFWPEYPRAWCTNCIRLEVSLPE
ncbi:MAG: hypothetical protein N2318_11525 [Meiothermus sp.]|nr:hypothetical protein [Meiothermus sp.]